LVAEDVMASVDPTQPMTEPSIAIDPVTARMTLSARFARKLWWANRRWKPTVTPRPVRR